MSVDETLMEVTYGKSGHRKLNRHEQGTLNLDCTSPELSTPLHLPS